MIARALCATVASWATPAFALDKQGAGAHGGEVEGGAEAGADGFDVEGAVSVGLSIYNPTYGARPDNTGRALLRYAVHADVDLVGRKLSLPVDLNLFTDRLRAGAAKAAPTELDAIGGVTTTWPLGPGALEIGSRVEHDRPVDRGSFTQTYVDARARWLYSLRAGWPSVGRALGDGDVSGWLTLGWFAVNPSYAARPDNSGIALLRYGAHTELSVLRDVVSVGFDATLFTDRDAANPVRPTEIDATPEIIGHVPPWEVHLAYEKDVPLDRGGLSQSFVYVLLVRGFDLMHAEPPPLETRGGVPSP